MHWNEDGLHLNGRDLEDLGMHPSAAFCSLDSLHVVRDYAARLLVEVVTLDPGMQIMREIYDEEPFAMYLNEEVAGIFNGRLLRLTSIVNQITNVMESYHGK